MDTAMLVKLTQEVGLPIGIFGLCVWMVVFIVQRLSRSIDDFIVKMEVFCAKVHEAERLSSSEHKDQQTQHFEMIKMLGKLNGYKEGGS